MPGVMLLATGLGIATVTDLRRRMIPDFVHILLLLSGISCICLQGGDWRIRLAGFLLVGGGMLAVAVLRGGIGGGDVKLAACLAFAVGLLSACYVLLVGLCASLVFGLVRKAMGKTGEALPLAPFLAAGCVTVLLCTA